MTEVNKSLGWRWADLDPKVRVVLATAGQSIGNNEGELSETDFATSMLAVFPYRSEQDSLSSLSSLGPIATSRFILDQLSADPASIHMITRRIGELAGGSDSAVTLARRVGESITRHNAKSLYIALPALEFLSESALRHNVDFVPG